MKTKQGIKAKDGKLLVSDEDIKKRWEEYIKKLYHDDRHLRNNENITEEAITILEEE